MTALQIADHMRRSAEAAEHIAQAQQLIRHAGPSKGLSLVLKAAKQLAEELRDEWQAELDEHPKTKGWR